jgi:hypothetical protein
MSNSQGMLLNKIANEDILNL